MAIWITDKCIGGQHQWVPTGKSWKEFTSNRTLSKLPTDAREVEELRCAICGKINVREK